jgi:hypothetical protein
VLITALDKRLELSSNDRIFLYVLDSKVDMRSAPRSSMVLWILWMLGSIVTLMSHQRLRSLRVPVSVGFCAINDGPDFLQLLIRQLDLS